MIQLTKIKIKDMLDTTVYWVQCTSGVHYGSYWKFWYMDNLEQEVIAYGFKD